MTRIIHLSDLHFGAHDERLVEAVDWQVDALKPGLVVISGDFTQRARTEQFREACRFLEALRERGHEVEPVLRDHGNRRAEREQPGRAHGFEQVNPENCASGPPRPGLD